MARSKSMWRKHMHKPVRKARRVFKKAFPQIRQPKGKGKGRYNAMMQMSDQRHDQVYFGGKGKSKGKRQTTGKGFGRRSNPIGPDGETMKCTVCNSTVHFGAACPQHHSSSSSQLGLVNPNYLMTAHISPRRVLLQTFCSTTK